MNNLAVIPARGGSKRIPRKNIIPFLGEPLISYSIRAAIESGLFNEIMVSTDDEEIAMTAEKYGATVPFLRSAGNSDHFATLADVLDEVIGKYRNKGTDFKHLCCILPTAALISVANLKKGYDLLNSMKYYSVRPVVRFSYPIQRALFMEDGMVDYVYPEHARTRSQDLDPAYHDAGQFYWLFFNKGFDPSKKGAFEISEYEAHDIDTWEDLKIAEYKYSYLKKQRTTRD